MLQLYALLSNMIQPTVETYVGHYPTLQDGENKVYPYAEILVNNAVPNNEYSDNDLLSINVYDNMDTDINRIESISTTILNLLKKFKYIDNNMQVSIYRNSPHYLTLNDEMIGIARRELRFICRVYKI